LVEAAKAGRAVFVLSDAGMRELSKAPADVREIPGSLPLNSIEMLTETSAVAELRDAYLRAEIVGPKSRVDAMHVAYATIARVDAIVSWNFKHIVRFDHIRAFNQINFQNGYGILQIVSPKEVLFDE
jgi:hypothetical protein